MSQPLSPKPMNPTPEMLRAAELFSAAAIDVLSEAEAAELAALKITLAAQGVDVASLADDADRIVGEALVAMASSDARGGGAEMPADAKDRLISLGVRIVSPAASIPISRGRNLATPTSTGPGGWLGWTVAAAASVVATLGWMRQPASPLSAPVPVADQRRSLINEQGTLVLEWSSGPDPAGKSIKGDIVWNNSLQKGFLRLQGAVANDPSREQYQLWIFDDKREQFPVDGGVFNFAAPDPVTGEILIPIDAKLKVFDPSLFAVTIEQADGVVVTKKDRIVAVAKAKP